MWNLYRHSYNCRATKAPTSWKELAEIEARNRAAEQLANISEDAGDAKSYDADDFDQFSDASRSTR